MNLSYLPPIEGMKKRREVVYYAYGTDAERKPNEKWKLLKKVL